MGEVKGDEGREMKGEEGKWDGLSGMAVSTPPAITPAQIAHSIVSHARPPPPPPVTPAQAASPPFTFTAPSPPSSALARARLAKGCLHS